MFPTGLLDIVQKEFPQWEYVDERFVPRIEWGPFPQELYYKEGHQIAALEAMKANPRGTIEGITAMGKTFLEAGFAAIFDQHILILSHRREIFDNIVQRCEELVGSEDVGIVTSRRTCPKRVTVAMVGSLLGQVLRASHLKHHLDQVTAILVDEAHHISMRSQYAKVIQLCQNAYYRYGLTATPWRDSGDTISVFAFTGPIIYSYCYQQACREGVIVPLEVFLVPVQTTLQLPIICEFKDIYTYGVVKNDDRNRKISQIAEHLVNKGENVLILVWRLSHGRILNDLISRKTSCDFIHGTASHRNRAKKEFEDGSLPVLIASGIYDEGVDINRVQNVIIAAGYKSERLLVQRTGRGLRVFDGKTKCRVFDFMDFSHDLLLKHSKQRLRHYKKRECKMKYLRI